MTAPMTPAASARVHRADDPRRFAARIKVGALAVTVAGFSLVWGLVSQNVVGITNSAPTTTTTTDTTTESNGRAAVPSSDFFGPAPAQPQPLLGNGGGQSRGPMVRSGST